MNHNPLTGLNAKGFNSHRRMRPRNISPNPGKAINNARWGAFPTVVSRGMIEKPVTGKSSRLVDSAACVLVVNTASVSRRTSVLIIQGLSRVANRLVELNDFRELP